jgi:hypothetical protein
MTFSFLGSAACRVVLAGLVAGAAPLTARATDLPLPMEAKAPPLPAPPMPASSLPPSSAFYNWSGVYVGGHLGHFWGRTQVEDDGVATEHNARTDGIIGGAMAGSNWQIGPAVFGLEGDFGWTNAHGVGTGGNDGSGGTGGGTGTGGTGGTGTGGTGGTGTGVDPGLVPVITRRQGAGRPRPHQAAVARAIRFRNSQRLAGAPPRARIPDLRT